MFAAISDDNTGEPDDFHRVASTTGIFENDLRVPLSILRSVRAIVISIALLGV